jgi:hypothetical protein
VRTPPPLSSIGANAFRSLQDLLIVETHTPIVAVGDVCALHVLMTSQFVDIFTKGLPSSVFLEFWSSLNIYSG